VRIARFSLDDDLSYGVLDEDGATLVVVSGDPLVGQVAPTGRRVALADVRLLAPVIPRSKVIAIGRNYADHAAELGNEVPPEPLVFLKPNTSVIGPGDPIVRPTGSTRVDFEGELAVVIGRIARYVPEERVPEVIFGYTVANDVTERNWQKTDGQWWRAKGADTFCPLGPFIETSLDVADLRLTTRLDGEVLQRGSTSQMVFDVPAIVSFVSSVMTLLPGDVILTGTPAGVAPMVAGQRVEVEIEGIGTLSNPVIDA
jgi:2-keto-4-pentenoate hydratase/2-oxohepta-3-ene-1,7-dioic acid hydratase in catechol pathway